MKKVIVFLMAVMVTVIVWAQAPQKMSYQAVIRNSNNNLVVNTAVGMKISILQGSGTGTVVYAETQTPIANANGLITVEIGGGTVVTGIFANIDWTNGTYFIKTETDPTGSTNYSITGISQMLSVPYALYAKAAGSITNLAISQQAPTTEEIAPTNILAYSATLNSIVNGKGFSTGVSFDYGTTTAYGKNITATQSPVTGSTDMAVSANITGLQSATTYHYRVKATNAVNETNSPDMTFATVNSAPQLTSTAITGIFALTATGGGNVTYDGGSAVTARGVCWSTSTAPTIALSTKTTDGTGNGSFTSSLTALVAGTKYYVRSYATNSVDTGYGNEVSFTTQNGVATLNTTAIIHITGTSASSGGNITADGGSSVTARGICWSTSTAPTVALSTKTVDGSGLGTFTSTITGLVFGTTYFVRSYATNGAVTSYGNEITYTFGGMGSSYQSGIVFYLDGTGHGIICAPTDQSAGMQWYNGSYTTTGATGSVVGTGFANTNTIVDSQGAGSYAAKLCYDLVLNTYSDWYLPSKDELNLMYVNLKANGLGSFSNSNYWSSTEVNYNFARGPFFSDGTIGYEYKNLLCRVRAVRNF